jgi:predicted nucleic acid-binding protein
LSAAAPVLVDTSVWIDFFAPRPGPAGYELRRMIVSAEPVVLAGIIVTEILQGLIRDVPTIERFLAQWDLIEPAGFETYAQAAALYRETRAHALTLTTVDVLIATLAIENRAQLFTLDKDFERLAHWAPLLLYGIA